MMTKGSKMYTSMFIWIGLLLSTIATGIFAQEKCIPDTQCSCNLKDGRKISLWPIDNGKKSYARYVVVCFWYL